MGACLATAYPMGYVGCCVSLLAKTVEHASHFTLEGAVTIKNVHCWEDAFVELRTVYSFGDPDALVGLTEATEALCYHSAGHTHNCLCLVIVVVSFEEKS